MLTKIFSITNRDRHKVLTILGVKVKHRLPYKEYSNRKLVGYIEQLKYIMDSCCDITKCKPATGILRYIQETRLKAFKYILKIFEKEGILYWLDGGTLLGAYRHKGFIPWDDDMDIATDRENYNKIRTIFDEAFKDTEFRLDYGQNHTGFYMKIYFGDLDIVDVFPYDYSDSLMTKTELYELWLDVRNKFYEMFEPKNLWEGEIKIEDTYESMNKLYKEYKLFFGNNNKWLFKGFDGATKNLHCNIFPVEDIFPLQKACFEDLEAYIPNNAYNYLSTVNSCGYGDIMAFPPLSTAHVYKASEYDKDEFLQILDEVNQKLDKYNYL